MDEDFDSSMDSEQPPPERKEGNNKCFHLFNCDKTYNLKVVGKLINDIKAIVKDKLDLDLTISTEKYFRLFEMSQLCETIQSGPPMDFAIFVVHANESRLSINEENAGIGYARFYKALLQAAGERVLVVIGGDDNYKGAAEEETAVLSRWAKRQISSQFKEEFMDGRKSFIFSWNKEHRSIHEEALLHFLDHEKTGTKFVHAPKHRPTTTSVDTIQVATSKESGKVDVKAKTVINYSNVQPVKDETNQRYQAETRPVQGSTSICQSPDIDKPKNDQPVQGIPEYAKEKYTASETEITWKQLPKPMTEYTSSQEKEVVFLCRDQADIIIIKDVFGDELITASFSGPPDGATEFLLSIHSVRSCIIAVDARTIEEEVHGKSFRKPYEDLLGKARGVVEAKVVIIICSDKTKVTQNDEDDITHRINLLLGDKGIILWWKGNKTSHLEVKNSKRASYFNRSKSLPDDGAAKRSMEFSERQINPEASTLLLKTRLRHGTISYLNEDVEERLEGWVAPKEIEDSLKKKWSSTADAELLIYLENETEKGLVTLVKKGPRIVQLTDSLRDVWQNISETASAAGCLFLPFSKNRRGSSSSNDMELD